MFHTERTISLPELRYDILSGTYTVIASERAKRPNEFRSAQECKGPVPEIDPGCPFCTGNEGMTPPEIYALRDAGQENEPGWRVRIVPNKFPALRPVEHSETSEVDSAKAASKHLPDVDDTSMYWCMPGIGAHEVVIESNRHNGTPGTYTIEQMAEILETLKQRYRILYDEKHIRYVQIFRNWGPEGGASLLHPHFQIIGLPFVPPEVSMEISRFREYESKTGRCVMCDYIERETEKNVRIAAKNDEFIALCPFASKYSFETLVVPRKHSVTFSELDHEKARQLADILISVFRGYEDMFSSLSHNMVFHTLPPPKRLRKHSTDHWHIHVYPRLNVEAGLEKGAAVWINPTPPELAAVQFSEKG
ncbi:MAG TPA: galactose-1-phosphate uridylyltransferase [Firmicutes bacterium]|nr:galactose-1-phosphate uridylyltransferase [Candidatus Fermentithermobacillaceae bacterium]